MNAIRASLSLPEIMIGQGVGVHTVGTDQMTHGSNELGYQYQRIGMMISDLMVSLSKKAWECLRSPNTLDTPA